MMPPHPLHATDTTNWRDGWYRPADHLASENFDARPATADVDLLVLHSISLPPGVYEGDDVLQLFSNRLDLDRHPYYQQLAGLQLSPHFFLRRDGRLWQLVSCDQRAWHAGTSRYRGRDRCNDDSIGIELEGLEGLAFDDRQYPALAELCQAIASRYSIRHLAGHEHIAPGRKTDPGAGFDWQRLRRSLAWDPAFFPPDAGSVARPGSGTDKVS